MKRGGLLLLLLALLLVGAMGLTQIGTPPNLGNLNDIVFYARGYIPLTDVQEVLDDLKERYGDTCYPFIEKIKMARKNEYQLLVKDFYDCFSG